MLSVGLPISVVRQGRVSDCKEIAARILSKPNSAWLGCPAAELDSVRDGRDDQWFVVAAGADDRPVSAVFYTAGSVMRIPNVRITAVAVDPDLGDVTTTAVAMATVQATVDRFFKDVVKQAGNNRPCGYVATDVRHEDTEASETLRAGGWRCLQPRVGWPTDRLLKFLDWGIASGEEETPG